MTERICEILKNIIKAVIDPNPPNDINSISEASSYAATTLLKRKIEKEKQED
jgi:hypothetical protein